MALKLRLATFEDSKGAYSHKIKDGSNLAEEMSKLRDKFGLESAALIVAVNGHIIPEREWPSKFLMSSDEIIVAPDLQGGDNSANQSIFTSIALIAGSIFAPGIASTLFGTSSKWAILGVNLGIAAIATNLVPRLFPVSTADELTGEQDDSQTYVISAQSNKIRQFSRVPKVYGTHKVFPTLAATPYTELRSYKATNESTPELVQYFYAIYDFGLGPVSLSQIKIGDSPLQFFKEVKYNLVDLNRPATNEGNWDIDLQDSFDIYKGDVERDVVGVTLEKNENDPNVDLSEYQVVRSTSPDTSDVDQEITINFSCRSGLYSIAPNGNVGSRTVDLDIEIKRTGEPDSSYVGYKNTSLTKNTVSIGGDVTLDNSVSTALPLTSDTLATYTLLESRPRQFFYDGLGGVIGSTEIQFWGVTVSQTFIVVENSNSIFVNQKVYLGSREIGRVVSLQASGISGFTRVNLALKSPKYSSSVVFFERTIKRDNNGQTISVTDSTTPDIQFSSGENTKFRLVGSRTAPHYGMVKIDLVNPGQYDIRITRTRSFGQFEERTEDSLTIENIVTRYDRAPIVTNNRHTYMEIEILATDQINGTIQNLSAVASSVLDVWDGSQWVKQVSSNPAWIVADIITGQINKNAVEKSRLDTTSLKAWADYCDEVLPARVDANFIGPRFESNFVFDYAATVKQLIDQVAGAAKASLTYTDGQYGVLIDEEKTTPIQIFTPRNSSGFSSSRNYSEEFDAIKISYIDTDRDWKAGEVVVYNDGQTAQTAEKFDEFTAFACTNPEQAWRLGRYMLAMNRLRQETITIDVDFENLVCTRGDYVQFTQDVMKVGGTPARVKSVSGTEIVVDDGIDLGGVVAPGYTFRSSTDGSISTGTLTVIDFETFDLAGTLPAAGDLIVIGETGSLVYDCIVKEITPNPDYTATLTLVERANAIHDTESGGDLPVYNSGISSGDPATTPPGEVQDLVVIDNSFTIVGEEYQHFIEIDWDAPANSSYETFEVYVNNGQGFDLLDVTKASRYKYIVDNDFLDIEHQFKVLAVSSTGVKLELAEVTGVSATPETKTTPPSDVTTLDIDIVGETLQLFWERVSDIDVREYLIRYSPNTNSIWETSVPLVRADKNLSLITTHARTGIYLIKAVDYNDNESEVAAAALTTIPELFNLNLIETLDDFPGLAGEKDRLESDGPALFLQRTVIGDADTTEYETEGYYYFSSLLDLGDIFTTRVQSQIEAEGYTLTDIIESWDPLSDVTAMTTISFSDWNVELQYRGADFITFMSSWTTLDSVSVIQAGNDDNWTDWRNFIMGDITARLVQFRLKLTSLRKSISPRVTAASVQVDMPDRTESFNNVTVPIAGLTKVYSRGFKGPGTSPVLQVTIDDIQTGDYWQFTSRTLDGFTIQVYDFNDNAVERNVDITAIGFGRKAAAII